MNRQNSGHSFSIFQTQIQNQKRYYMAKRPHLSRPVPVKEVVRGVLSPGDRESLALRQRIRRVWEAVVPAPLLSQTRLVDLRRKELWVEVSASPWGQELQFLKPKILAALEQALGPGKVKEVRVRVGDAADWRRI
jgi:hypothetical protein